MRKVRKPKIAKRTKSFTDYHLSKNIDVPLRNGSFKPVRMKNYITTRQWFNTKGRLFLKCLCYNVFSKSNTRGGRKLFKGKKTINYVSAEHPNISKHRKLVKYLCFNRASYEHIQKGGKSSPIIEVLDWIVKYQTFYNDKVGVPLFNFRTRVKVGRSKVARNVVFENTLYNKGSVRFKPKSYSEYSTIAQNDLELKSAFNEFADTYYDKDVEF